MVPFSPSSGLLEWVENTLPLSDYLLGAGLSRMGGAHARYRRPGDLTWVQAYQEVGAWGGAGREWGGGPRRSGAGQRGRRQGRAGQACKLAGQPPTPAPCPLPPQLAKEVQGGGRASHAASRAAFDSVCARFPPVMHHFFLETFGDPGEPSCGVVGGVCWVPCAPLWHAAGPMRRGSGWRSGPGCLGAPPQLPRPCRPAGTWFERRLAYTRSMAVNSMAGYIIGLGDRHLQVGPGLHSAAAVALGAPHGCMAHHPRRAAAAAAPLQNVLLDTSTADAVHIDLGIAFEQVGRRGVAVGVGGGGCVGRCGAGAAGRAAVWARAPRTTHLPCHRAVS